ncbi:hypothetical protein CP02DC21_1847 [Chlamydia psittaci 02DC21]|nr:hypothetical protein CP02DC21_1847 [Chlamydia psittaci 02DC21]
MTRSNQARPVQTGFDGLKPDSNRTRPAQTCFDWLKKTQT